MSEEVHYDDAEIEFRTDISGWVTPDGRYFGDNQHLARWNSCTTVTCASEDCDNHTHKQWTHCLPCRNKTKKDKWEKADKAPLSVSSVCLWSDAVGEYFSGWERVEEYCEEFDSAPEELLLYHCKRNKAPVFELEDFLCDIIPEDHTVEDVTSSEVIEAASRLNKLLQACNLNSYSPSKIAVEIKE